MTYHLVTSHLLSQFKHFAVISMQDPGIGISKLETAYDVDVVHHQGRQLIHRLTHILFIIPDAHDVSLEQRVSLTLNGFVDFGAQRAVVFKEGYLPFCVMGYHLRQVSSLLGVQGCGINGGGVSSHPYDVRVTTPVDAGVLCCIKVTVGSTDMEQDIMGSYVGIEPLWHVW